MFILTVLSILISSFLLAFLILSIWMILMAIARSRRPDPHDSRGSDDVEGGQG